MLPTNNKLEYNVSNGYCYLTNKNAITLTLRTMIVDVFTYVGSLSVDLQATEMRAKTQKP